MGLKSVLEPIKKFESYHRMQKHKSKGLVETSTLRWQQTMTNQYVQKVKQSC